MFSPQCKLCSLAICRNLKDLQVIWIQSLERKRGREHRIYAFICQNLTFNDIITQTVHLLSANTTLEYYTCIYASVNYISTNRHALWHLILCMSHLVKTSHGNHLSYLFGLYTYKTQSSYANLFWSKIFWQVAPVCKAQVKSPSVWSDSSWNQSSDQVQ